MGLREQRNIGYGLTAFGITLMTGFGVTAYGQVILFLLVLSLTGITLGFLTVREAINFKTSSSQDIGFQDCVKIIGGLFGLIFLAFLAVLLLGIIKGI